MDKVRREEGEKVRRWKGEKRGTCKGEIVREGARVRR
jgi:hypothetical protein